jgi:DNA-binding transcriptional regulator YiaG
MNISIGITQGTGTGNIGRVIGSALVIASMLGTPVTSNAYPSRVAVNRTSAAPNNAGLSTSSSDNPSSTARGILAIRQIANLTWDETAQIFGVSRRTVHLWANGRHPSGDQERKLNRILGILGSQQNLGPSLLRERLMASAQPGTLFFDLLCNDELDTFQSLFSSDNELGQCSPPSLHLAARTYTSQPPVLLLDAIQDRPVMTGKTIAKKSVRLKRQDS